MINDLSLGLCPVFWPTDLSDYYMGPGNTGTLPGETIVSATADSVSNDSDTYTLHQRHRSLVVSESVATAFHLLPVSFINKGSL